MVSFRPFRQRNSGDGIAAVFNTVCQNFGILNKTVFITVVNSSNSKVLISNTGQQHALLMAIEEELENYISFTEAGHTYPIVANTTSILPHDPIDVDEFHAS